LILEALATAALGLAAWSDAERRRAAAMASVGQWRALYARFGMKTYLGVVAKLPDNLRSQAVTFLDSVLDSPLPSDESSRADFLEVVEGLGVAQAIDFVHWLGVGNPSPLITELLRRFCDGKIVGYDELSEPAKHAVVDYMSEEHRGGVPVDKLEAHLRRGPYSEFSVPRELLTHAVMASDTSKELPFDSFEEYHRWWSSSDGREEAKAKWPVLAPDDGYPQLFVGQWDWFHEYVKQGVDPIPVLSLHPIPRTGNAS
jgi:hypothetical protein